MDSITVLKSRIHQLLAKFGLTPNALKSHQHQGQRIANKTGTYSTAPFINMQMQDMAVVEPMMPEYWYPRPQVTEETAVASLTKPKMRGLLAAQTRRNVIFGFVLAGLGGLSYKVLVADVRKQRYADFYRNLDAEKEFEVMRKKGVFQSC